MHNFSSSPFKAQSAQFGQLISQKIVECKAAAPTLFKAYLTTY